MLELCGDYDDLGNPISVKVIDYINEELKMMILNSQTPDIEKTFEEAIKCSSLTWEEDNRKTMKRCLRSVRVIAAARRRYAQPLPT